MSYSSLTVALGCALLASLVAALWNARLLFLMAKHIAHLKNELYLAELDAAIAGTETGAYWRGNDDAFKALMAKWEESLEGKPRSGALGHWELERLYARTNALAAEDRWAKLKVKGLRT